MPIATREDKRRFLKIIVESFWENPSVNQVIDPKKDKKKAIQSLASYAFETAYLRDGVFISEDREAIALCYPYNHKGHLLVDAWLQLKLAFGSIGLLRVPEVMKRERYVKNHRDNEGNFLYFWFFGASQAGKKFRSALSLKNEIFKLSEQTALPIYLETSVPKNRTVYERYGFSVYHEQLLTDRTLFFMKRDAHRHQS